MLRDNPCINYSICKHYIINPCNTCTHTCLIIHACMLNIGCIPSGYTSRNHMMYKMFQFGIHACMYIDFYVLIIINQLFKITLCGHISQTTQQQPVLITCIMPRKHHFLKQQKPEQLHAWNLLVANQKTTVEFNYVGASYGWFIYACMCWSAWSSHATSCIWQQLYRIVEVYRSTKQGIWSSILHMLHFPIYLLLCPFQQNHHIYKLMYSKNNDYSYKRCTKKIT